MAENTLKLLIKLDTLQRGFQDTTKRAYDAQLIQMTDDGVIASGPAGAVVLAVCQLFEAAFASCSQSASDDPDPSVWSNQELEAFITALEPVIILAEKVVG